MSKRNADIWRYCRIEYESKTRLCEYWKPAFLNLQNPPLCTAERLSARKYEIYYKMKTNFQDFN